MGPESLLPFSQYPSTVFCPKIDEMDSFQLITNVVTADTTKYIIV